MSATVETLLPNVEKHILLVSCVNKKEKRKKVIPHILDTFVDAVVLTILLLNSIPATTKGVTPAAY
jgi:hypothetical protein